LFWLHVNFGSECPGIFKISHKKFIFTMQCAVSVGDTNSAISVGDTNHTMEVSWAQTTAFIILTVKDVNAEKC
jgi:metallophosphoesterase superfamily enzyme